LAFVVDRQKSLLTRSIRQYRRSLSKVEREESALDKKIQKSFLRIKTLGNDDHLSSRLFVSRYSGKGLGLKAAVEIPKGSIIGFYGGELKFIPQSDESAYVDNHYLFSISMSDWCIDGKDHRALTGMMNHSSNPNATSYLIENGLNAPQIAIMAKEIIAAGKEITISYNDKEKGGGSFFDASNEQMQKV